MESVQCFHRTFWRCGWNVCFQFCMCVTHHICRFGTMSFWTISPNELTFAAVITSSSGRDAGSILCFWYLYSVCIFLYVCAQSEQIVNEQSIVVDSIQPFIQAPIKEYIRAPRHWPVNSPHKGPVTRMFPFVDVIMVHRVLAAVPGY